MDDVELVDEQDEENDGELFEGRRDILIVPNEKTRYVAEVIEAIKNDVYQKGNVLVRPIKKIDGMGLEEINPDALDLLLHRRCIFSTEVMRGRGENRQPQQVSCAAPPTLARQISNLQQWKHVKSLNSVARVPYLRPNGTVGGLQAGYDGPAKCWSVPGTAWLPLADAPSDAEAKQALATLSTVVDEFPFESEVGLAVFVSAVLSIVARRAIKGPVPLFVIDASTPGAGKTLLATAIAMIGTGKMPGVSSAESSESELKKAITAHLISGETVVVFDNCTNSFGGATLDRFLTSTVWTDRLMQTHRNVSLPNECVVLMTANNATVRGDTARRSISLTLKPDCERPEERDFRKPSLINFIRDNRRELVHAALTILRWHIVKGMPQPKTVVYTDADGNETEVPVRPFGSFEEWSKLVRYAVIGLGLRDPVKSTESIREIDENAAQRRVFLESLAAWKFDWQGTSRSLIEALYEKGGDSTPEGKALRYSIEQMVVEKAPVGQPPSAKTLGYRLRDLRDRYYSGFTLRWVTHAADGTVWRLDAKRNADD